MKYGTVVITGASAGLGEEFAQQMAGNSEHLVLVARRADRLESIQQKLADAFPQTKVSLEVVDLNDDEQLETFASKLQDGTYEPHVLVNNAGMGDLGSFRKSEWPKVEAMMNLNMTVLTRLAHAAAVVMSKRKRGEILNVSSMASMLPIPDFAVYAATKAYVTSFSEALKIELKEHNVGVTALCPGPVHTEFGSVANRNPDEDEVNVPAWAMVSKEKCVRDALNAMDARRARIFPGMQIKAATTFIRMLPMPLLRVVLGRRPRK